MHHRSALIAVLFLVSFAGPTAFAQHNHSATAAQTSAPVTQSEDLIQQCHKHHMEGVAALDQAAANLAQAKQLFDPDDIRGAIDSAQKQIAEAKHHFGMCPMVQDGDVDHSQHKMKCMSKDSQSE